MYRQCRRAIKGATKGELYDEQTFAVMRRYLDPDSSCIDVGAHSGEILREIVRLAPRGRHFAFEPIPALAEGLRGRFPAVEIHACALSDSEGETTFNYVSNAPAYSGLRRRAYDRPDADIQEIQVPVRRLDDVVPRTAQVRFVKIDVEGAEYWVMKGGSELIRRCHPIVVFEAGVKSTSFYDVTPAMIFDLLVSHSGLKLSTMARLLAGKPDLSEREFAQSYHNGEDFYFVAYPQGLTGRAT